MRRVIADGAYPVGGEQVREDARHRAPVLHHIGHPGRRPQVVLEHPEVTLVVADQVDAGDVDAYPVGWDDARGFPVEVLARGHQPTRDHAVAQDLLLAIDVVEIHLQRLDPLGDAPFSRDHSAAEITRGTRSSGNGRSWPDNENVMP